MQSPTIPLLLIAAVVGGVVAAGVCALWLSDAESDRSAGLTAPVPSDASQAVLARLDTLSQQVGDVADRVATLERQAKRVSTSSFSEKKAEERVAELSARLEALEERPPSAPSGELAGAAPVIDAKVETALRSIRKRETANKWRNGTNKRQANLDRRLARMQASLNLSPGQVDSLRQVHEEQHQRTLEVIQLWEEGQAGDEALGGLKRTNHQTYQESLASILTPTQLQQHQQQQGSGGKD